MSAKDRMLDKVRRSLGRGPLSGDQRAKAEARLKRGAPTVTPARGQGSPAHQIQVFQEMAEKADAQVRRLSSWSALPKAVALELEQLNLSPELRISDEPRLTQLDWRTAGIQTRTGLPDPAGDTVLSLAVAGVAETGTVVAASSPRAPNSGNFLPDTHMVVLPTSKLVGSYEAIWDLVAEQTEGLMPRALIWITGPSRTGDIEQTLQLGAHGPLRLFIFLVDG